MCFRLGQLPGLRFLTLLLLPVLSFLACESSEPISPPDPEQPSFEIVDGVSAIGNPDFFFLPPLVPDPAGTEYFDDGAFDPGLSPLVQVWALPLPGETEASLVAAFTMEGTAITEPITASEADEHYQVNWHLDQFTLTPEVTYQIRVLLGDNEMGHADVDLVSSGKELKNVDTGQFIALKDGRTLPIKFRLEDQAGSYVGPAGGTVSSGDDSWSVRLEPRTVVSPVRITGTPISPPEGALPGATWHFGPEGTTFDPPATLTLRYDPGDLTPGKYPRLHKRIGDMWEPVEGSAADLQAGTVSGPVSGFSDWTILEGQLVLTVDIREGNGFVWVEGVACGREATNPCEIGYDLEDPPIQVTLLADTDNDEARFEEWIGTGADFTCTTDPECTFAMTEDRDVTARFSMPGLISVSATSSAFEMPYGGVATPASDEITVFLTSGRAVTLEPVDPVYSPGVTPWLQADLSTTAVEVGSPATLTLSVLPNDLSVGTYTATVLVTDGYYRLWPIQVALAITGTEVVVDGSGRHFGPLPVVPYAFADAGTGNDIYPLGDGGFYLFGLFDTGSTRVRVFSEIPYYFNAWPTVDPNLGLTRNVPNRITDANWFGSDASLMGLGASETVRVRLNGLSAIDPGTRTVPLGPPGNPDGAQAEATNVQAQQQPGLNVTLIGAPVAEQVVAVLDYTERVTRQGYDFYPGLTDPANSGIPGFQQIDFVEGPDITFHAPGAPSIPAVELHLQLERFGTPQRWRTTGLEFRHGGAVATDDPGASLPFFFLFDTGTTPTIIGDVIAGQLGLTPGAGSFSCLDGANNGFAIDEIVVAGIEGTYRIENPSVCVSEANVGGVVGAVIGSNLFDQVPVVFDGPGNRLGIGAPTNTPVSW